MIKHIARYTTPSGRVKQIVITRLAGKVKELVQQSQTECIVNGYNYNGYGYADHEYIHLIPTPKQYKAIADMVGHKDEGMKMPKDPVDVWVRRLVKLTSITEEEAKVIAEEKIAYKEKQIQMMEERQAERYSIKREKLIAKMRRENPLRRIKDVAHAEAILQASYRHNCTDYESRLEEGRERALLGEIDQADIKGWARTHCQ